MKSPRGHEKVASMATPRHKLVDDEHAACYHLTSRCVQQAWLLGYDPLTRRDYSHRKGWLVDRMKRLARCFAVEIFGYAVMSNHFHMVLRYDPKACDSWTPEEVARRWVEASEPTAKDRRNARRKAERCERLLEDPEALARARRTLGSLSGFMKQLRISSCFRRANRYVRYCFNGDSFPVATFVTRARSRRAYNEFATFWPRVVVRAANCAPCGISRSRTDFDGTAV